MESKFKNIFEVECIELLINWVWMLDKKEKFKIIFLFMSFY